MSDKLYPLSIERLLGWILAEESTGQIFGIPRSLFYIPQPDDVFRIERYGQILETPIGVAAGPHTQLAQSIVSSWLVGARYIELKTVQTLDEIEVSKPCIDMEDEGYNCEWSQELRLAESFDEYLNAWILINILKDRFGWGDSKYPGFIFNMSAGYDLAGIRQPNVQLFLDKMMDAGRELESRLTSLSSLYPRIKDIIIPAQITNNITLSTMHGCPPEEIEKIGRYLIEERRLHTTVKLNPTLLGPDRLRSILNTTLGYDVHVPDEAFKHDLKYQDALQLIESLQKSAEKTGVCFGLKLTNTLEVLNRKESLPAKEKMTYLSGRALQPLSVNLAYLLQKEFSGKLDISFSAGVDCFNVADILACNIKPVTVCSDLLKPGGYTRFGQYLSQIDQTIRSCQAHNVAEFISTKCNGNEDIAQAGLANLKQYADSVLTNPAYRKTRFPYDNIKTDRTLTTFDCIQAPCINTCAIDQDIPDYMFYCSRGEFDKAYEVIVKTNPFPNVTGMVCDHLCQSKCTRINYDNPLLIRNIKRFIAERGERQEESTPAPANGLSVAIIGSGPSGLSCAYFLTLTGFKVEVFESKRFAGGLISDGIPGFRLSDAAIRRDIERILALGVKIHYNTPIDGPLFEKLRNEYDYIYVAVGAQKNKRLDIPGENANGVLDPLTFLAAVRRGNPVAVGPKVAVIGGGNSAMDAARTAHRLIGKTGRVTVVYRRTRKEMPVDRDEVEALLKEGITLQELIAPESITVTNGNVSGLVCTRMKLVEKDASGRAHPLKISDSEFEIPVDTIIPAIGQEVDVDFLDKHQLIVDSLTNETQVSGVFAGGDMVRGADSLINAISDGKHVAENIQRRAVSEHRISIGSVEKDLTLEDYLQKQSKRQFGIETPEIPLDARGGFDMVHPTLDANAAQSEAERCLYCDNVCNICISVCPNRANVSFTLDAVEINVQQAVKTGDKIRLKKSDTFRINQKYQILNIADFCNECGNCTTFCPTSGSPFRDKPRFYLTEQGLNQEEDGFFFRNNILKSKVEGRVKSVTSTGSTFVYDTKNVSATFNSSDYSVKGIRFINDSVREVNLYPAIELIILMKALNSFYLFKD